MRYVIKRPPPKTNTFAAVISEPGADRQRVHPDILCVGNDTKCPMVQVFVALADISSEMGPTTLWPQTHRPAFQHKFVNAAATRGNAIADMMMFGKDAEAKRTRRANRMDKKAPSSHK